MIQVLLTAALFLPLQDPTPPDPARVEKAVAELEEAFKDGEPADRANAIARNARVPDAKVVSWIERGLRDKTPEVRDAAIEALRYTDHPDALKALHAMYKRDRPLRKEPEPFTALLRAIGQHGDPSSIDVLSDDVWAVEDANVIRARLYGLGNIRDVKAAEALIGEMKARGRMRTQPYMGDFRLSLMVLTGADQGTSQDAWLKWWNDHKGKLEVAPEEPKLPEREAKTWSYYWGRGPVDERPRQRQRRGGTD